MVCILIQYYIFIIYIYNFYFLGKFLRVITKLKEITTDKKTAEECRNVSNFKNTLNKTLKFLNINIDADRTILASHLTQTQVKLAKKNLNSETVGKFSSYINRMYINEKQFLN